MWRYTHSLVDHATAFLKHMPFSLAQTDSVEKLQAAQSEYLTQSENRRHRVSDSFFSATGSLNPAVLWPFENGRLHDAVVERIRTISLIPITEQRSEQPHSVMHREQQHARRATRVWHASTVRLEQNIREYKT